MSESAGGEAPTYSAVFTQQRGDAVLYSPGPTMDTNEVRMLLDIYEIEGSPRLAIIDPHVLCSPSRGVHPAGRPSFIHRVLQRAVLGQSGKHRCGVIVMHRALADALIPHCTADAPTFVVELVTYAASVGIEPVVIHGDAASKRPSRASIDAPAFAPSGIGALWRIRRRASWIRREHTRAWSAPGRVLVGFAEREIAARGVRTGVVRAGLIASLCVLGVPSVLVLVTLLASMLPSRWDIAAAVAGLVIMSALLSMSLRRGRRSEGDAGPSDPLLASSVPDPHTSTRSRVSSRVFAFAIFVAGALVTIAPASARLTTRYAGYSDSHYWFWMSWRAGQALRHGQSVLHYPDVVWPYGLDIKAADGFLPTMVGGFWNLVIPNPVLAYNLAIMTALVSTACAGAWLAARVTGEHWIHVLTGLALMTATVMSVRVNIHFNLLFTVPAVLLVGRAVEIAAGDRIRVVRDGALIALAYLSSGYFMAYGLIAATLLVVLSPGLSATRVMCHLRRGCAAIALVIVVLSPFLVAKLRLEHDEARAGAVALSDESSEHSADPFSLLQPPPGTLALPGPVVGAESYSPFAQEATTFPGVVLVGSLVALVAMKSRLRRALLLTAAGLWLLSLGPRLSINGFVPIDRDFLPSALLTRMPGMRGMRDPNRAGFLIVPVAGVAFAVCMERARRVLDGRTRRITIGVLVGAMVVGLHVPVSTAGASGAGAEVRTAMRAWGTSGSPGAVLILPDQCTFTLIETRLQLDLRRPIVGCQGFSASLPFASGMAAYRSSDAWAALRCDPGSLSGTVSTAEFATLSPSAAAIGRLRTELDVGLVVFDRVNNCPRVSAQVLDLLQHNARSLADDGRFALFELPDGSSNSNTNSNGEVHP